MTEGSPAPEGSPALTERHLNVFVFDRNNRPIPGAKVLVTINGHDVAWGTTQGKAGAPLRLQTQANVTSVTLRAEYGHDSTLLKSEPVTVDLDEGNVNIYFSEVEMPGEVPKWFPVAGFASGAGGLLFFMYVALFQPGPPTFAHVIVVALTVALAVSFLGGDAAAKGNLPIPFLKDNPMAFTVGGGIATFVIVLVLGYTLFLRGQTSPVPHPDFVSMGFDQDRPLSGVVNDLESSKNVTVAFVSCPAEFAKTLVAAGTHSGNTPKEFLEQLQQRLRNPAKTYVVTSLGSRYEIVCS